MSEKQSDSIKPPREKFMDSVQAKQGDDDAERDMWTGSYSPKAMTGQWILAAALTVGLLLLLVLTSLGNTATAWKIALVVIALGWLYLLGLLGYRKFSKHYELTSQRLKHREGILMRKLDRIELIDIDDVMYKQGPIQALLRVGNIVIESSDKSHPILVLYGIENVKQVAEKIDDARRAERRKRGLHIESI